MPVYKRHLITSALPYANGPVHIGHLAGVYIPSDIYARYLRLIGKDVLWVCGSDEHGVPITLRAKKEGISPQDVVDRYHNLIKRSFEEFGISVDIYSRTGSEIHAKTASDFFKKLYEKNVFIEKTTQQYFDETEQQFLADRYIKGTCPKCGNDEAYGDQCEKCGSAMSPEELLNPKSTISGGDLQLKETKHWFLPLDKYESFLRKWILEEHKEWKVNVSGQCKSWLDAGLKPRAVTRDLNWGIPVPLDNAEGKVLYVWFDAPIGYISATKELTEDWELYWKDKETQLVHFIGKDNIVFHCIIFPAMLHAEGSYILPENVPANAFLNLENNKISTSKNWAVWLHEYLEDFKGKQDVLRYVLTAIAPETRDSDFTWKDFQERNNSELVNIFGNFFHRTVVLTHKYYKGVVPEVSERNPEIFEEIIRLKNLVSKNIETYKFREAQKEMMNLARLGNKYLADNEPWKKIKTEPQTVANILFHALQIAGNLMMLAEPFLPFTSKKMRHILDTSNLSFTDIGNACLPSGHTIRPAEMLFEKIEDEAIAQQIEKLKMTKRSNSSENPEYPKIKPEIQFDDFMKPDIRTATILEAEKVPKTDKLLKIKLDTGIDRRIVVSGIAKFYAPEEIIGKQVLVLVNLAPRKLRGIESQGMILMAEDAGGKLCFVSPEEQFQNGAVIG
ncbi:MAG: methionine--tRNA ligase [Bacteroidia bacterium]|nr:MAG: methionine--tRNA ligase [Bacteroidia bacterium]